MSVLIKGMEKPKSCTWWDGRCPLLGDDDDCKLQDCQEEWTWQDQYKGCPLSDAPDTNVDTISRQDVLALAKDVTLQNGCKHRCIDATMIHELPPAQLGTMAVRGYPIDADYLMAKVAEEYGERARDALYRIIRYMPPAQPEPSQVARDIADIIENEKDMRVIARSEITDEQAILHLQASGWMQRHDKEMYESGLRARLTDDSDSYDALLESVQPEQTRIFVELVVEYPDPELCTYKEYRGKPYYSIKYIENGETHIGFGTYKPEVLSQYLKENFISSAQPEIVRCKDCKHWEGECRNGFWYFEQCSLNEHVASSDDFCSWAERRTDETD